MSLRAKRERILALDLLRGYFLAVIVIDHLAYFPSLYEFFTGRGYLWASAAEGFFLISGMLVGYVYTSRMLASPVRATLKLWRRAAELYIVSILLTLLFVWWGGHANAANIKAGLWINPEPLDFIYKVFTLQYSYGWADFLQYYVMFMLFAPLALWLCTRGKAWLVALLSLLVWVDRGKNFTMGLQFIFMLGLVGGYYLPSLEKWFRALPSRVRQRLAVTIVTLAGVTMITSALAVRVAPAFLRHYGHASWPPVILDFVRWLESLNVHTQRLSDKWSVAPMRIGIALLWFTALYLVFRRYEHTIDRLTRGFLRVLGANSLFVYSLHAIVVFAILSFVPKPPGLVGNMLLTTAALALVYIVTRYRRSFSAYLKLQLQNVRSPKASEGKA